MFVLKLLFIVLVLLTGVSAGWLGYRKYGAKAEKLKSEAGV